MYLPFYSVLFSLGLLFLGFSMYQFNKTKTLLATGTKTEATVIELTRKRDSEGDISYSPVFEYYTSPENSRIFNSPASTSTPTYQVGDQAQLVFNPDDFSEVRIVSYWGLYVWTIVLAILASISIIIGGGFLLYTFS